MQNELSLPVMELSSSESLVYRERKEKVSDITTRDSKSGASEWKSVGRIDDVVIGKVVGRRSSGEVLVDFPENDSDKGLVARSTKIIGHNEIGRQVALMFEQGDPTKPVVLGFIKSFQGKKIRGVEDVGQEKHPLLRSEVDGERLVMTAEKEIVLRCGEASITLTRAGKVLIRGAYVSSRSSGVNRIKGGSVQIN
jgi:hypothetical protein